MKKLLLLPALTLIFLAHIAQAQLINPGFETWTPDLAVPSAMNPNNGNATTGWCDYNSFNYSAVGGSPISVLRSDTAHSGTYSARIQTVIYTPTSWNIYKSWGVPYIGHNYSDTLGILFDGNVNELNSTYKPGIPFTQKIISFSFYYQYAPQAGDTAECRVALVKARSTVAGGVFKTNVATGSTWNLATVNMFYLDTLTPDTMYILFSSSSLDRKPKPGSVLRIDDVSVTLPTGISETQALNTVSVFPNPSNGKFTIQLSTFANMQLSEMDIYNVFGERIYTSKTIPDKSEVDLSQAPDGIYFMQLRTSQGILIKKLIIRK
jgi:hypothetical protein